MEYEKIKQLMKDMENSKLIQLDIDFPDGTKIRMRNEEKRKVEQEHIKPIEKPLLEEEKIKGDVVTSPMVGTFYAKPSPNSEPYVQKRSKSEKR